MICRNVRNNAWRPRSTAACRVVAIEANASKALFPLGNPPADGGLLHAQRQRRLVKLWHSNNRGKINASSKPISTVPVVQQSVADSRDPSLPERNSARCACKNKNRISPCHPGTYPASLLLPPGNTGPAPILTHFGGFIGRHYQHTDNAYVHAEIARVSSQPQRSGD